VPNFSFSLGAESNVTGVTNTFTSAVELTLNLASAQDIKLNFTAPTATGSFQSLQFTIRLDNVVLSADSRTFDNVAEAEAFFTATQLDLGIAAAGDTDLLVSMTYTDDPAGDSFTINGYSGVNVIPEPSSGAMILAAGLWLGWRRRRTRIA
jgi:hypothetical protein